MTNQIAKFIKYCYQLFQIQITICVPQIYLCNASVHIPVSCASVNIFMTIIVLVAFFFTFMI